MYHLQTNGELVWVEADALSAQPGIVHAFSTRHGGCSDFPYQSLNLGLHTKDDMMAVRDNRDRFVTNFGISPGEVVSLHFIHSNKVLEVRKQDGGRGFHSAVDALGDADGMITNEPRRALFITYADCVPVLFYDAVNQAVGACHAGWRGTVAGVVMETVRAMEKTYGSKAEDLLVAVGPAIDPDHFEVGQDVVDAVSDHAVKPERLLRPRNNGKYLFNIWQVNIDQVMSVGVQREHVTLVDLSTFARDDLFFSHRRRFGGEVGRQAAFIMLK